MCNIYFSLVVTIATRGILKIHLCIVIFKQILSIAKDYIIIMIDDVSPHYRILLIFSVKSQNESSIKLTKKSESSAGG